MIFVTYKMFKCNGSVRASPALETFKFATGHPKAAFKSHFCALSVRCSQRLRLMVNGEASAGLFAIERIELSVADKLPFEGLTVVCFGLLTTAGPKD